VVQTLRRRHAEPIRCCAWDVPAFRDMPAMKLTRGRSSEGVTLLRAFWYSIDLKGRATKQHEDANTSPLQQRALSAHACDVAADAEFQFVILFTAPSEVPFPASANQAAVDESKSPCGFSPP
jgi:hypothetical protein